MTAPQNKQRVPLTALSSRRNLKPEAGVNSIARAAQNQEKVLRVLARFGWLPLKQVAAFCWPDDKTARCAERTLAALRKHGLVRQKVRLKDKSNIFALTETGVEYLAGEYQISAIFDPMFAKRVETQFEHRALSNETCVWWKRTRTSPGAGYFTEYEIVKGLAPLHSFSGKGVEKIPDALLVGAGDTPDKKRLGWVEVEREYKKDHDQNTLVAALCQIVEPDYKDENKRHSVTKGGIRYDVIFAMVVCQTEALKARLCQFLFKYLKAHKYSHNVETVMGRIFILDPHTHELVTATSWTQKEEYADHWKFFGFGIEQPESLADVAA